MSNALRRSTRVLLKVPLVILGTDAEGYSFQSLGETAQVNRHGARIRSAYPLSVGAEIIVIVKDTGRRQLARVVWADDSGQQEYGVELSRPENLWGISFPPSDWLDEPLPESVLTTKARLRTLAHKAENPKRRRLSDGIG